MRKINLIIGKVLFIFMIVFIWGAFHFADTGLAQTMNDPSVERLSDNPNYAGYAYLIDRYNVDVTVHENNSMGIVENIEAFYNQPKHGIIRTIPLTNTVNRLDGTTSNNRAKVTDFHVNANFSSTVTDGNKVIKIGDENATILGSKAYTIEYNYSLGRDTSKEYDEFYINLIGNEWDTAVGGVSFTVRMPKEFDAAQLGFTRGPKGSVDTDGIQYQVVGNVIIGTVDGVLNPGEGLTIRVQLPEGYFANPTAGLGLWELLSFLLPILFVLITFFLWIRFGKDPHVVETVEFYPPEGFNSAEVGYLYSGNAQTKDVVSLLIYLANKGYLKITEMEEKSLFSKSKSFKLEKLKEYDGDNGNERTFLNGLFQVPKKINIADLLGLLKGKTLPPQSATNESRNEVTADDLNNSFYITTNKIIQNLNGKENKYTVFEKTSLSKGLYFAGMLLATYCIMTLPPLLAFSGGSSIFVGMLFPGIGFTVLFAMVFGKTKWPVKIFGLIWGLGFGGMPWAMVVLPALQVDFIYMAAYFVGLVCVFLMVMIFKAMPKRTPYGSQLLGKIKGFRTFLETAEKQKLEMLVEQDPTYFYNILPYAYALDVSDKWIRQFETIALQTPDWYAGSSTMNASTIGMFMNSTMSTAQTAMSSGSSGSGSSGGGSSGGGSGGGGGSSW